MRCQLSDSHIVKRSVFYESEKNGNRFKSLFFKLKPLYVVPIIKINLDIVFKPKS